jgi:TonB family protein
MAFFPTRKRVLQMVLLLWGLPSAAYALADDIVSQVLKWLLVAGVGLVVVVWGLVKLLAVLIEKLGKVEAPEAAAADGVAAAPAGAGKVQPGLVVRALLLSFPLQLGWLWLTAYPVTGIARPAMFHGYYMHVLAAGVLAIIPTVGLMTWLWRTRRPNMALGIGLSGGLIIGGFTVLMMVQAAAPADAAAATPNVIGPDQLPHKVYTYVEEMPTFPGGPDSLQAFVRRNLHYPSLREGDQQSGTVHLHYVVGPEGYVAQVQLTESMGAPFDDEAVRVVRSLPQFTPGRHNDEAVAVLLELDIAFDKPAGRP